MRRATNQKHGRRDDEPSDEEDGSEDEVRVSNAQRGRVRLHGVVQSSNGLEIDDDRRKSLGEKGWARRSIGGGAWVESSGAADLKWRGRGVTGESGVNSKSGPAHTKKNIFFLATTHYRTVHSLRIATCG